MRFRTIIAAVLATTTCPVAAQVGPLPAPQIFAPGIVSGPANDGAPTFSPDGRTMLFERSNPTWSEIMESHFADGRWSKPELASFTGPSSDQQPTFSPDGRHVVYASSRVIQSSAEKGSPLELVTSLWQVDSLAAGWSEPMRLPAEVNISKRVFKPSIATNGDLYFMADQGSDTASPHWRLYRAEKTPRGYVHARPLAFSDGQYLDVDPYIAPDQSFMIFSSKGRPGRDDGHEHLFFVRRNGAAWGEVAPIRYLGDDVGADDGEAQMDSVGKTLYFTSSRTLTIHRMRGRSQMIDDFARLEAWDNGNNNAWTLDASAFLEDGRRATRSRVDTGSPGS